MSKEIIRFKNKKTGLIWEIADEKTIYRLKNDSDYVIVEDVKIKAEKSEKKPDNSGDK